MGSTHWEARSAIVPIARKLLVAIWHVLTEQEADVNAELQAVTRKLLNWITHTGTTPGLSNELEEINYYGQTYRLSVKQQLLREAQKSKRG